MEFNINHISPIDWNEEVFAGLVLPEARKNLLRSLIEANGKLNEGGTFDDFVRGKGQGLVINLFGNPGTGKSLTAEAMSECKCFLKGCCAWAGFSELTGAAFPF